jgi:predicted ribosomally synthesized peptide with nif11-like leader
MSIENADQFLIAAARSEALREQFQNVHNPDEFAALARTLGYEFTPDDLKAAVTEHSRSATQRRHTGVWEWLRTVPWMER